MGLYRGFFVAVIAVLCCYDLPNAAAQVCDEYFSGQWARPLEMNQDGDILYNIVPAESHDLTSYSYAGGIFSAVTTGTDPWFNILTPTTIGSIPDYLTTRHGENRPIDPARYHILKIRLYSDRASDIQIFWSKANGWAISNQTFTTAGWREYTIDMNTIGVSLGSGGVNSWAGGLVTGLRIDPMRASGATFMIDYIRLTPDGCTPGARVAPILQPDVEGGDDYFLNVRGNAANMDTPEDIDQMGNTSSSVIYNGKAYTDSAGISRIGDFLEARNVDGSGDPVNASVYNETLHRIDASRYKIACWTLDLLKPVTTFHSVARVFWERDGKIWTGDDVINRTNGEGRYCVRMDTMQTEPPLPPGTVHPWRNNSNGSGLSLFRIDPHEDVEAVTYRLNDVRLATDHYADQKFAIVVGGDRDAPVTVYYDGPATGVAGTLPAGRSSDVILWNSSGVPNGFYSFRSVIDGRSYISEGRVFVEHGSSFAADASAPILRVYAPLDEYRFNTSIALDGYAVDNRRIATVEVLIDGALVDAFRPSLYDRESHDARPSAPYASTSGFQRMIAAGNLTNGNHSLVVKAFDTAGNVATHAATIVRAQSGLTADYAYPQQMGTQYVVPLGVRPKEGENPANQSGVRSLSLSLRGSTLSLYAKTRSCAQFRITGGAGGSSPQTVTTARTALEINGDVATVRGNFRGLPSYRPKNHRASSRIFLLADCGNSTRGVVKSFDARKIRGRTTVRSISKVLSRLRGFRRR